MIGNKNGERLTILHPHIHKYDQIKALLETAGARFVHVEFIKRDGSLRKMTIQPEAVKTHVKGDAAAPSAKQAAATRAKNNPNLLNVYDVAIKAIRSVNMDTIQALTIDGTRYNLSESDDNGTRLFLVLHKGSVVASFTGWEEVQTYATYLMGESTENIRVFEFHPDSPGRTRERTEEIPGLD